MNTVYHRPPVEEMTVLSLRARERQREAERARRVAEAERIPPPSLVATVCTGEESFVPDKVKAWQRLAARNGWRARVTRAVGPRIGAGGQILEADCRTLAVALQGPAGDRVVALYRWNPKKADWDLEDVQDGRTGELVGAKEAQRRIRG